MRRSFLSVLAVIVIVGVVAAANMSRDPRAIILDWQLIKPQPREVTIESPARGPIVQTVTAPGIVEPVVEAKIASQIVGRVVEVRVKDGDSVKKGDLLVKLDETQAKAMLDSSAARIAKLKAAISQAEAEREKADRDVNRSSKLAGRGVATPTELADARSMLAKYEAALLVTRNDLRESEAMRRTSQQDLDRTEIRAPIDGVVAACDVQAGEVVIAGTTNLLGTVLMTVGDLSKMQVRAEVDETDVPLVKPNQPARVYLQADPSRPINGKVDRVAPKGKKTEEVVSFETLVLVGEASGSLRSEMTATVEIEVRRADEVLGIPVQAVVHRRRKDLPDSPAVRAWSERHSRSLGEKAQDVEARYVKIVFVLEQGVARARPVETGISDEKRIEILFGLEPTDKVIVAPFRALDELKDGNPVTPAKIGTSEGKEGRPS
jgi:HlyD family secretion protein